MGMLIMPGAETQRTVTISNIVAAGVSLDCYFADLIWVVVFVIGVRRQLSGLQEQQQGPLVPAADASRSPVHSSVSVHFEEHGHDRVHRRALARVDNEIGGSTHSNE